MFDSPDGSNQRTVGWNGIGAVAEPAGAAPDPAWAAASLNDPWVSMDDPHLSMHVYPWIEH